jgi:hypothetical protein
MKTPPFAVGLAALAIPLAAQVTTITEERVRETVTWLAADERAGRDTGSPQLVAAGEWIAARFAAAGLQPLAEGRWTHEFALPGSSIDSKAIEVRLHRKHGDRTQEIVLQPDVDVRQWTVADATTGGDEACTVAFADDAAVQRMLDAGSARRPVICEVATGDVRWGLAQGSRFVLGGRRQATRPVFLVRAGLLPLAPDDGSEVTWTATWSVPEPEKVDMAQHNVVGMLRGGARKDEYVVVSAHYDHVGRGREVAGDGIYNGADDNATGTTAVLLLAEALGKLQPPPARSILFVCFTAEERGLLGSKAFCARPPVPIDKIAANLNIEMIGRPLPGNEGKAWITGHDLSDFAAIAGAALERAGIGLVEFPMAARLFTASDNWSFAQRGVVAHSLSAGSLHQDYHQPGDEVDKLDVAHMTRIVRGLHEVTLELANRDAVPQWNDKGRARIARR